MQSMTVPRIDRAMCRDETSAAACSRQSLGNVTAMSQPNRVRPRHLTQRTAIALCVVMRSASVRYRQFRLARHQPALGPG